MFSVWSKGPYTLSQKCSYAFLRAKISDENFGLGVQGPSHLAQFQLVLKQESNNSINSH